MTSIPSPKTLKEIQQYLGEKLVGRIRLKDRCDRDAEMRLIVMALLKDPEHGASFFINNFGVTFEPRINPLTGKRGEELPFLLFPKQEEFADVVYKAILDEKDLGAFKPRDIGLSWILLHVLILCAITQQNFNILVGTYKKELNDENGTPAELFWKIDFILDRLPKWLIPEYDRLSDECKTKGTRYLPQTNAKISARAPNPDFAVSDRTNVVAFDDWGRWQYGYEAWEAAGPTSQCRIVIYTVNETNPLNHAWEYDQGKLRFENIQRNIFNIDWKDDLRKLLLKKHPVTGEMVNAFLLEEIGDPKHGIKGRSNLITFARAYKKDFEAATKGRIYANQMTYTNTDKPVLYDPSLAHSTGTGWDFGYDDTNGIVFIQWNWRTKRFQIFRYYESSGHGISFYKPMVNGLAPGQRLHDLKHYAEYDQSDLDFILETTEMQVRVPYESRKVIPYEVHGGDPYGRNHNLSDGRSAQEILAEADPPIFIVNNTKAVDHKSRIDAVRDMLMFTDIDERLTKLIDSIKAYKMGPDGKTPVHDAASHPCNALAYYAVNSEHMSELPTAENAGEEASPDALQESIAARAFPARDRQPGGLARRLMDTEEAPTGRSAIIQRLSGILPYNRQVILPQGDNSSSGGDGW